MNNGSKNKLLTGLVIVLLVANAATIALFWFGKNKRPEPPKGSAKEFMVTELKLDAKQQEQLESLVKEHRQAAETLRGKIKESKEAFFDLLKQTNLSDSIKQAAAKAVSTNTEELDLLTLAHFQKIRALCNPSQQQKFDEIIHQVTAMMGQPRPPMGPNHIGPGGPPPGGPGGEHRPPPPGQ